MQSVILQGHLEYFICNSEDLSDPEGGSVTQGCFNMHALDRAEDDGSARYGARDLLPNILLFCFSSPLKLPPLLQLFALFVLSRRDSAYRYDYRFPRRPGEHTVIHTCCSRTQGLPKVTPCAYVTQAVLRVS